MLCFNKIDPLSLLIYLNNALTCMLISRLREIGGCELALILELLLPSFFGLIFLDNSFSSHHFLSEL